MEDDYRLNVDSLVGLWATSAVFGKLLQIWNPKPVTITSCSATMAWDTISTLSK